MQDHCCEKETNFLISSMTTFLLVNPAFRRKGICNTKKPTRLAIPAARTVIGVGLPASFLIEPLTRSTSPIPPYSNLNAGVHISSMPFREVAFYLPCSGVVVRCKESVHTIAYRRLTLLVHIHLLVKLFLQGIRSDVSKLLSLGPSRLLEKEIRSTGVVYGTVRSTVPGRSSYELQYYYLFIVQYLVHTVSTGTWCRYTTVPGTVM